MSAAALSICALRWCALRCAGDLPVPAGAAGGRPAAHHPDSLGRCLPGLARREAKRSHGCRRRQAPQLEVSPPLAPSAHYLPAKQPLPFPRALEPRASSTAAQNSHFSAAACCAFSLRHQCPSTSQYRNYKFLCTRLWASRMVSQAPLQKPE